MKGCDVENEYFMMRSDHLTFRDVRMKGKYSFQYITDCVLDTKDTFWHGVCRIFVAPQQFQPFFFGRRNAAH